MKLELNLSKMLDTMSKEAILAEVAKSVDIAVTKKIEEETALKEYRGAQERVALGTYTSNDLMVLQRRLDSRRLASPEVHRRVADKLPDPKLKDWTVKTGATPKSITPSEMAEVLNALGVGGKF